MNDLILMLWIMSFTIPTLLTLPLLILILFLDRKYKSEKVLMYLPYCFTFILLDLYIGATIYFITL